VASGWRCGAGGALQRRRNGGDASSAATRVTASCSDWGADMATGDPEWRATASWHRERRSQRAATRLRPGTTTLLG
jgi:hypothetical protein